MEIEIVMNKLIRMLQDWKNKSPAYRKWNISSYNEQLGLSYLIKVYDKSRNKYVGIELSLLNSPAFVIRKVKESLGKLDASKRAD